MNTAVATEAGLPRLRSRVEHVMGTAFGITVDEHTEPAAVDAAFAWLHLVDATFSTYRDHSEVSRLDRGELALDDAAPDVRQVLDRCAELSELTDGWFTARPSHEGATLDPSGLVKGWSIDEAAVILRMGGARTFSINGGGDIVCAGSPRTDAAGWRTGVRHPDLPTEVVAVLDLDGQAIATSGTYERGEHIWGARGGSARPSLLRSVTVVGPLLGTADALATALYAEGSGRPPWLGRFPGYELLLVTATDELHCTAGITRLRRREEGGPERSTRQRG